MGRENEDISRIRFYPLVSSTYFVEGIASILTSAFLPVYLIVFVGLDITTVAIYSVIAFIPWTFKPIWGFISDEYSITLFGRNLRRRPYIVIGSVLNFALLPFLVIIDPFDGVLYVAVWFFQNLGWSILDTCVDALSVENETTKRNLLSMFLWIGSYLGTLFAGFGIGSILMAGNFVTGFVFGALVSTITILFVIFAPEREVTKAKSVTIDNIKGFFSKDNLKDIFSNQRFVIWGLIFAAFYNIDSGMTDFFFEPWMVAKFGATIYQVGQFSAVTSIFAIVGAIVGWLFGDRIRQVGHKKVLSIALLCFAIGYILSSFVNTLMELYYVWVFLFLAVGFGRVALIAIFMDITSPRIAGVMFAFYMAFLNIGTLIGRGLAGVVVPPLGMEGTFFLVALFMILLIIPANLINTEKAREFYLGG
jgi:MFS family permease